MSSRVPCKDAISENNCLLPLLMLSAVMKLNYLLNIHFKPRKRILQEKPETIVYGWNVYDQCT